MGPLNTLCEACSQTLVTPAQSIRVYNAHLDGYCNSWEHVGSSPGLGKPLLGTTSWEVPPGKPLPGTTSSGKTPPRNYLKVDPGGRSQPR